MRLGARLVANPPDLFIGVDAPDFNLGLEARLRSAGHSRSALCLPFDLGLATGRVQSIARSTESMSCASSRSSRPLLTRHGIDATYVGHPLAGQRFPTSRRAVPRVPALGSRSRR
jgi:lipid-A-disaccharide synthase